MANDITIHNTSDGPHVGVTHITLVSDGTLDITDQVVVDSSVLFGGVPIRKIVEVHSNLTGFTATLSFKETSKVMILELPIGHFHQEFNSGALVNPQGAGSTGDIVCDTAGFTAVGDKGHIIIKYKK